MHRIHLGCLLALVFQVIAWSFDAAAFAAPLTSSPLAKTRQPQNIHPAVCRIVAPGKGSISFGSGTLIDANEKYGLVITNWHVVNESTGQLWVMFPDGFQSPGAVQKADRDWDLAAIAIFRPNAQPVKVAGAAPRPGEMLTIAGYGSGDYRAVSGQCTQYVAPGLRFPYEMVELAATARQGDSGGPIFNNQGELAGVLFGAGGGRTSGSYSGRVQWFLSSLQGSGGRSDAPSTAIAKVAPQPPSQQLAQNSTPSVNHTSSPPQIEPPPSVTNEPVRVAARDASVSSKPIQSPAHSAPDTKDLAAALPASLGPTSSQPVSWPKQTFASADRASPPPADSTKLPAANVQHISLAEMLGPTPAQQLKTILAAVGLLTLLVKTLAWLTTPPPKPKKVARA